MIHWELSKDKRFHKVNVEEVYPMKMDVLEYRKWYKKMFSPQYWHPAFIELLNGLEKGI